MPKDKNKTYLRLSVFTRPFYPCPIGVILEIRGQPSFKIRGRLIH